MLAPAGASPLDAFAALLSAAHAAEGDLKPVLVTSHAAATASWGMSGAAQTAPVTGPPTALAHVAPQPDPATAARAPAGPGTPTRRKRSSSSATCRPPAQQQLSGRGGDVASAAATESGSHLMADDDGDQSDEDVAPRRTKSGRAAPAGIAESERLSKVEERKRKNRESAQRSRAARLAQIDTLRAEVAALQGRLDQRGWEAAAAEAEVAALRQMVGQQMALISQLHARLAEAQQQQGGAGGAEAAPPCQQPALGAGPGSLRAPGAAAAAATSAAKPRVGGGCGSMATGKGEQAAPASGCSGGTTGSPSHPNNSCGTSAPSHPTTETQGDSCAAAAAAALRLAVQQQQAAFQKQPDPAAGATAAGGAAGQGQQPRPCAMHLAAAEGTSVCLVQLPGRQDLHG